MFDRSIQASLTALPVAASFMPFTENSYISDLESERDIRDRYSTRAIAAPRQSSGVLHLHGQPRCFKYYMGLALASCPAITALEGFASNYNIELLYLITRKRCRTLYLG